MTERGGRQPLMKVEDSKKEILTVDTKKEEGERNNL